MNLEIMAMRWLWLEKKCHYVLEQRSPRYMIGLPDVLGVTATRHLTEIEIKRSVSDFRADAGKCHRRNREDLIENHAKQFYYLVPRHLKEKVEHLVPEWAGFMVAGINEFTVDVIKVAPINKNSKRLTVKECIKLARCMTNHMMTICVENDAIKRRHRNHDETMWTHWVSAKNGVYEI